VSWYQRYSNSVLLSIEARPTTQWRWPVLSAALFRLLVGEVGRLVQAVSRSCLAAQHWAIGETLALPAPAEWGAIEHVVV
jgi:hypothetical protein